MHTLKNAFLLTGDFKGLPVIPFCGMQLHGHLLGHLLDCITIPLVRHLLGSIPVVDLVSLGRFISYV